MNKINILWVLYYSLFYTLAHASENIELIDVAYFGENYTYYLKDIAPEQITQMAVNSSFAYLLTKKGNLYAAQGSKDLSKTSWKMVPASSDISLIALFPEQDTFNKHNIMYATHNYIFKDRTFLYNSATKQSIPLTTHNRAIYKIGSVFDQSINQFSAVSGSTFPSMQLLRSGKISPLKNAYLMYAQDAQLVYAELQSKKDDRINLFERIIGKKLSYTMRIVWDTARLDSLTLIDIDKDKKAFIKTDPENELVVDINNSTDLPLVAVSNVQDKLKTVAVVMQYENELKIVFNYWLDEIVTQEMLKNVPPLDKKQKLEVLLHYKDIRSFHEIESYYYKDQKDSMLNKYQPFTYTMNIGLAEPVQAVYLTYSSARPTLDDVVHNKSKPLLLLVYQKSIRVIFVNDLKNGMVVKPKIIDMKNRQILCVFFDSKKNVLYCVTKDQEDHVVIESKDVNSFF